MLKLRNRCSVFSDDAQLKVETIKLKLLNHHIFNINPLLDDVNFKGNEGLLIGELH